MNNGVGSLGLSRATKPDEGSIAVATQRRHPAYAADQDLLVRLLDEAYGPHAWHGPNLRQSLRGVSPEEAAWRPGSNRHSIWEITVHCAYWTYVARRRLIGPSAGRFPRKGSNWFDLPVSDLASAWRADRELLDAEHARLRQWVESPSLDASRLSAGRRFDTLLGIACHHVYHAGQIRLLRRLHGKPG
jgi:DinB superfamily